MRQLWMCPETSVGDASKILTVKIPYLASRLGVEMVKGLQEHYTVASTGKHFAVYSVGKGAREGEARTDSQVSAT